MILTCPTCQSRFYLEPSLLEPEGKRVRCGECRYEWHQQPEEDDETADFSQELSDADGDSEHHDDHDMDISWQDRVGDDEDEHTGLRDPLPQSILSEQYRQGKGPGLDAAGVRQARRTANLLAAVVFILCCACIFIFQSPIMKVWPASFALYHVLGFSPAVPGEGLVFERLGASLDGEEIDVSGRIINRFEDEKPLPAVLVVLHAKDSQVVHRFMITFDDAVLPGEAIQEFKSRVGNIPPETYSAEFRFALKE